MVVLDRGGNRQKLARLFLAAAGAALLCTALLTPIGVSGAATTGTIAEFPLPTPKAFPQWITEGPNGAVWVSGGAGGTFNVYEVSPTGVVTEFPAPQAQSDLAGIATGADGNLWMAEWTYNLPSCSGDIVRMTPTGKAVVYPTIGYAPTHVTEGADGNVWFSSNACPNNPPALGRITPAGVVTEFPITTGSGGGAYGLTSGPDGDLWFTLGTTTGKMTTQGVPTLYTGNAEGDVESEIATGPDGKLWYTDGAGVNSITTSGVVTEYPLGGDPFGIVAGQGNSLVVTLFGGNAIDQLDLNGNVLESTPTPTQPSGPLQITEGSDGNFWFPEQNADAVGRFSTTGGGATPTTVTVSKSPFYSEYGQSVTLTATVTPTDGGGTVSFTGDGQSVGCLNVALAFTGGAYEATCTTSALPYGDYDVVASYSGDTLYQPGQGTLYQYNSQAQTAMTAKPLSSSSRTSTEGPRCLRPWSQRRAVSRSAARPCVSTCRILTRHSSAKRPRTREVWRPARAPRH